MPPNRRCWSEDRPRLQPKAVFAILRHPEHKVNHKFHTCVGAVLRRTRLCSWFTLMLRKKTPLDGGACQAVLWSGYLKERTRLRTIWSQLWTSSKGSGLRSAEIPSSHHASVFAPASLFSKRTRRAPAAKPIPEACACDHIGKSRSRLETLTRYSGYTKRKKINAKIIAVDDLIIATGRPLVRDGDSSDSATVPSGAQPGCR